MNFEINDYDSRQDLIEDQYDNNTLKDYEEEYEFQNNNKIFNNNIDLFIPPGCISNKLNNIKNINYIQNSLSNISNNISRYEEQINSNNVSNNNYIEGNNTPLNNLELCDNNNYNNKYINDNNSITLLNLTDKIYEDDDHFKKGIISKKNETKGNFEKIKPRKKKSSKFRANMKNKRKSLFIVNNNKKRESYNKNNVTFKKRRASVVVEHKNRNNFGFFNKIKFRKNNGDLDQETEKNNNDTNNLDDKKTKNKIMKNKTIKEEESNPKSITNPLLKIKKNKIVKTNKKNKLALEDVVNDDKEDKITIKKNNNNIKAEKSDSEKINVADNNENKKNQIQSNKKNKNKKRYCFLCCLNNKINDSDIISNKKILIYINIFF